MYFDIVLDVLVVTVTDDGVYKLRSTLFHVYVYGVYNGGGYVLNAIVFNVKVVKVADDGVYILQSTVFRI